MTLIGAYVGNGDLSNPVATKISNYELWLGRAVDFVALHTGANGWGDWSGSIGWQISNHQAVMPTHDLHWSIPLIPNWGASMAAAAQGSYASTYADAARVIANGTPGTDKIHIRTGWEFNATWSPVSSSAIGQPENYIGAYRNFVDSFRSVSDRFVFEWTPNIGNHGMNPADAYPGDQYVDIIGMDFYWDTKQSWSMQDPVQAWNYFVNQEYGLQWLENFADAHGKPTAYSEWGVNSDNAAYYLEQVAKWFEDHDVVYANYWESNAAFEGELQNGQYAQTAAIFKELFGGAPETVPDLPESIAAMGTWKTWTQGKYAAETITGDDRNNSINGGGGADTIRGGKGDDAYNCYGTETIIENAREGVDSVTSWIRTTTLVDNAEYLYIKANMLQIGNGNADANAIIGGTSRNVINGMGGNDWLTGGGNNDVFVFQKGSGHDVITDFRAGDVLKIEGFDLASYAEIKSRLYEKDGNAVLVLDSNNAVTFLNFKKNDFTSGDFMLHAITGTSGNDSYTVLNGNEVITELTGGGTDTVTSWAAMYTLGANLENLNLVTGSNYGQKANGNALDNVIRGDEANHVLHGMDGNDTIYGGAGDDWLYGDGGNDVLYGESGKDYLLGGAGADTFVFVRPTGASNVDQIKDFKLSDGDKIDISDLISTYDPLVHAITDYVQIVTSGKNSILSVDASGSGERWTNIAIIENATGLTDEGALVAGGALIV